MSNEEKNGHQIRIIDLFLLPLLFFGVCVFIYLARVFPEIVLFIMYLVLWFFLYCFVYWVTSKNKEDLQAVCLFTIIIITIILFFAFPPAGIVVGISCYARRKNLMKIINNIGEELRDFLRAEVKFLPFAILAVLVALMSNKETIAFFMAIAFILIQISIFTYYDQVKKFALFLLGIGTIAFLAELRSEAASSPNLSDGGVFDGGSIDGSSLTDVSTIAAASTVVPDFTDAVMVDQDVIQPDVLSDTTSSIGERIDFGNIDHASTVDPVLVFTPDQVSIQDDMGMNAGHVIQTSKHDYVIQNDMGQQTMSVHEDHLGNIDAQDNMSQHVGMITDDGNILGADGLNDGRVVTLNNGDQIIKDAQGMHTLTIKADGTMLDPLGQKIGSIRK
nr:MAG TPA: hypothetical protein [Caudoviricetes sp.]